MSGGIAIARNVLCIAHGAAHGHVVLVDAEAGRLLSRFAWQGDGGFADAAGIAVDATLSVYVADTRNDVARRFTAFGREVQRYGRRSGRGPGAVERDRLGVLDRPRAVAVHAGQLWVAGGDRKLVRGVQRFALAGGEPLGFVRSFGEEDRRFGAPRGLWVDAAGALVADTLHGVIQRFTLEGRYVGHVATAADPAEVSRPCAVLRLEDGDLLVADLGDRAGLFRLGLAGERRALPAWPPGAIEEPTALARDARGWIYVLDHGGERVQRLDPGLQFDGTVVELAELLED